MLGTYFVYKPGYRPYLMSENSIIQGGGSARNGVANQVKLCPVYLQQTANVQAITVTVTTGSAGTNCRLGLYRDVSGTPAGGSLRTESANISAASAVNKRFVFSSSIRLEARYVWCAFETQDSTVAHRGTANNLLANPPPKLGCIYDSGSFGNLTDPCPAVTYQPTMAPITRDVRKWASKPNRLDLGGIDRPGAKDHHLEARIDILADINECSRKHSCGTIESTKKG